MRFALSITASLLLFSSSLYANDFLDALQSKASSAGEMALDSILNPKIRTSTKKETLSIPGVSASCKIPSVSTGSICENIVNGAVSGVNSVIDLLNRGMNYSSCNLGTDIGRVCAPSVLTSLCGDVEDKTKTVISGAQSGLRKVVMGPMSMLQGAAENLYATGGDVMYSKAERSKSGGCSSLSARTQLGEYKVNSSGATVSDIYAITSAKDIQRAGVGVNGPADNVGYQLYSQCVKRYGAQGLKNRDELSLLCKPGNYQLPATMADVKNDIYSIGVNALGAKGRYSNYASQNEVDLQKAYLEQCSGKTGAELSACELKVYQEGFSTTRGDGSFASYLGGSLSSQTKINPQDAYKEYIKDIEIQDAQRAEAYKMANMPKNYLYDTSMRAYEVWPDNEKRDFMFAAMKQNMQEAVYISFVNRITEMKKELAEIVFRKIKECSKPFYYETAANEVSQVVTAAEAKAQQEIQAILGQ